MGDLDAIREFSLIVRARTGDQEAFLSLVQTFERKLLYYIRRFEQDPDKALDALQEVWLTAWTTIGKLRKPEAFRPWIYRIAHDVVVTSIRGEQRRRNVQRELGARQSGTGTAETDAIETADCVHHALDCLSAEHREVVVLRFLEGLTIAEIADATRSPVGTVKSRLFYAREFLQQRFEERSDVRSC